MTMPHGTLYGVPNTLDFGCANPADIQDLLPLGVLRIASRLDHWLVENAKTARAFLKRVDGVVPLERPLQSISIVELPRAQKGAAGAARRSDTPAARRGGSDKLGGPVDAHRSAGAGVETAVRALLQPALDGHAMGLLSEAGLPGVADPGAGIVAAAHELGVPVLPLPGASSLLLALAASGLDGQSFAFVGYLPTDPSARGARIRELDALSQRLGQTQIAIETPYRNAALLGALVEHLHAETRLSVSCGLTVAGGFTRSDRVAAWRRAPTTMPSDLPAVFSWLRR